MSSLSSSPFVTDSSSSSQFSVPLFSSTSIPPRSLSPGPSSIPNSSPFNFPQQFSSSSSPSISSVDRVVSSLPPGHPPVPHSIALAVANGALPPCSKIQLNPKSMPSSFSPSLSSPVSPSSSSSFPSFSIQYPPSLHRPAVFLLRCEVCPPILSWLPFVSWDGSFLDAWPVELSFRCPAPLVSHAANILIKRGFSQSQTFFMAKF